MSHDSVASTDPRVISTPAVTSASGVEAAPAVRRIAFVDIVRILASLQMLHGHTVDAVLSDAVRVGPIFSAYVSVRGLVSVAFLFAAGLSYHLSTLARFDHHRKDRSKIAYRFRRAAWLILLGYLLHFPAGIFSGDLEIALASLRETAIVDVLQCIGVSIIACELMTLFATRPRQVVIACGVLAILMFSLAPLADRLDPSSAWRPVVNYFTHRGGSLFPLMPWSGYYFAGVVVAEFALPNGTRTSPEIPAPRFAIATAIVLAIAGLVQIVPLTLVVEATHRNAEPVFNLTKLAALLAILAVLAAIGRRITRFPTFLTILAGESLILYVSHLVVLYGGGVGVHHWLGRSLGVMGAFAVGTAMVFFAGFVGLGWNRLKRWRDARR